MKILYVECASGISGNMLAGALYGLCPDRAVAERVMRNALPRGASMNIVPTEKCGVRCFYVDISADEDGHIHRTYADVCGIIDALAVPDEVKRTATRVYDRIAEAEARVHATTKDKVTFHEVGRLAAVSGVVLSCLLAHAVGADETVFSAIATGGGHVKCAHGLLPVPAPAVAELLKGVPSYGTDINAELCTVTGAALAGVLADRYSPMPPMTVEGIGCGAGRRDLPHANVLRAFAGEAAEGECATLISCNLDDMTGEALGYTCEKLLAEGAADVWVTPVQMKKNRPAFLLSCLCRPEEREKFVRLFFAHTTTAGVRIEDVERRTLARESMRAQTHFGEMNFKLCRGYGAVKCKAEADDVASAASERDLSFAYVRSAVDGTAMPCLDCRDAEDKG